MRIVISSLLGLLIIFGAVTLAKKMAASKNVPEQVAKKVITPASVMKVENGNTPITLTTSGNLMAKDRIDVYAEVTGVFEHSGHVFKPGSYFKKGDVLLRINSDEFESNIRAQKSTLFNQIALFLPDLKLDYGEAFTKWDAYVKAFDVNQPLPELPETESEKERLFILGKGIYSTFHNIRNLEERLKKYVIQAPFSGVLTDVLVNPGALVRNGQRLAGFISSQIYEMEVNVNIANMDLLSVGRTVELHNLDKTKTWRGRVARLDGRVDQASQTIVVYIDVSGRDLREGMFLEADLNVRNIPNSFEVDRKLLFEESRLFVVVDTVLHAVNVNPVFFKESSVVVQGLKDGTNILSRPIAGAYDGMRVEILK